MIITLPSFIQKNIFIPLPVLVLLSCSVFGASVEDVTLNVKSYGLKLNQNRVIFPEGSSSIGITVKNPNNYPVLVHSRVLTENKQEKGDFLITPPLFRLDAERTNIIKIIPVGTAFPDDREQLQWLCVKGIPPKINDEWSRAPDGKQVMENARNLNLKLSLDNCIKLIVRPDSLSGVPSDSGNKLTWKISGATLVASNPTPFYMNLSMIKLGDVSVSPDYVAPFAEKHFPLQKAVRDKRGTISWKILTDIGVESQIWTATSG
ncbi:TPA: fimbria/pilus periplasmic chaperone [Citrobacter werkmanii]|nr:fimbria/pilus periplasmic chaperone [Citrobacter werkmanii]